MRQQGMTLIGMLFMLVILGFVFLFGLRLFPIYYDYFSVKTILQDVTNEVGSTSVSPLQVWKRMDKHLEVNGIGYISSDALNVNRNNHGNEVTLNYDAYTPFVANIDLVVNFQISAKPQ